MPFTSYSSKLGIQNFLPSFSIYVALTAAVRSKKHLIYCLALLICCMDFHAVAVAKAYINGTFTDRVTGFVSGEFIGANSLGAFFVMSVPIAWFLFSEMSGKFARSFALASVGILLVGLFATQSRGGLLGICMIILLSICFSRKKMKTALLYLALMVVIIPMIPKEKLERFKTISISEEEMDPSSAARIYAWKKGIKMFLDYPIGGVGVGQFSYAFGKEYRDDEWDEKFGKSLGYNAFLRPHNMFIQVLAESGGIGFIAFMMIVLCSLRSAWRTLRQNTEFQKYSACLFISAIGYLTAMFFDHHGFSAPTYTLFALLVIPENIRMITASTINDRL
jgi:O-antigen ligase